MKKSQKPFDSRDNDEDRKRKLNFKKKKQRNKERNINFKNVRSMQDLDEFEDEYNF